MVINEEHYQAKTGRKISPSLRDAYNSILGRFSTVKNDPKNSSNPILIDENGLEYCIDGYKYIYPISEGPNMQVLNNNLGLDRVRIVNMPDPSIGTLFIGDYDFKNSKAVIQTMYLTDKTRKLIDGRPGKNKLPEFLLFVSGNDPELMKTMEKGPQTSVELKKGKVLQKSGKTETLDDLKGRSFFEYCESIQYYGNQLKGKERK